MPTDITSKLNASRKELLDLGLRNPLINYRTRARKIDIVDELPTEVYRILVTDGKTMTFEPIPQRMREQDDDKLLDVLAEEEPDWATLFAEPDEDVGADALASRHVDTKLQTRLAKDSMHAKLLSLHNNAKTFIEEQGVNILYLALGFLDWYESDSSDKLRRAPLILVPVELTRASAKERFRLRHNGDDIGTNLSLQEKLKTEFAIQLPEFEDSEDIDVGKYLSMVETRVAGQSKWKVAHNEIVLGFFSFGKFLMYKDLADDAWPDSQKPADHGIMQALLRDGFKESISLSPDDTHIDEQLSPADVHQVMDADSSQTLAILDVNNGHNMVVQGPPGTGKSQTITNIIAESIGIGKKVLFVSEKMAALEVVKRRLDSVGLGDAVLELHSHKTNKRTVLEELNRTLRLGKPTLGKVEDDIRSLVSLRDRLNGYCEAINTPVLDSGLTPVDLLGSYLRLGDDASALPRMDFSMMEKWTRGHYKEHRMRVEELQRHLQKMRVPCQNPFWGTRRTTLLPSDETAIRQLLEQTHQKIVRLQKQADKLAQVLQLENPKTAIDVETICQAAIRAMEAPHLEGVRVRSGEWQIRRDELKRLITAGRILSDLHQRFDEMLITDAWDQNLLIVRKYYVAYGEKWWRLFSGKYRMAKAHLAGLCKKPLPKEASKCIELVDAVLEARKQKEIFTKYEPLGETLFGAQWEKENSKWNVLSRLLDWIVILYQDVGDGKLPTGLIDFLAGSPRLDNVRGQVDIALQQLREQQQLTGELENKLGLATSGSDEGSKQPSLPLGAISFAEQLKKLRAWSARMDELSNMVRYNVIAAELKDKGLSTVLKHAEVWTEAAKDLLRAFDATWFGGLIDVAFQQRKELQQFDRTRHEYAMEKFCELDRLLFEHNRARLALQHWQKLPHLGHGGELQVIQREINKKRGHLPIRKLMANAGRAIQSIKPVFMMSPMSIANFLAPGELSFDLVIFDEASQVKPVDAFGAILRGKQVVVVGDNKQLPPTSFFDSLIGASDEGEEEESVTADLESILGLFLAQNAPERMLRWHYRSRHESLIAVSNHEFYDDKLVIFPSPGAGNEAKGLRLIYLPNTHYDRGKTRANPLEAKAVATAVMQHAKKHKEFTLGVAAFSQAQRDAIEFHLELLRRRDPTCEDFFNRHSHEPFFVKNLENVQGDERDVIFISIGYGKTAGGYMSMGFGPLNRGGGERRLNVLITRARRTCDVFANFTADDLDLKRSSARGVVTLKQFLAYGKDRILDMPYSTEGETDSPFEDSVIKALAGVGYQVEPQVGCAGFRVDIGVKDPDRPGRYLLGIECDGATYHSTRSARDRDRLRQEVLENLGWRIHRVWSTEWFRDPKKELERAVEAIERAKIHWKGIGR